jgi:hypothetical protein
MALMISEGKLDLADIAAGPIVISDIDGNLL